MERTDHVAALEHLVFSHRRALVRSIAPRIPGRLRGLICAEDVVQEASLEAVRCIGDFRDGPAASMRAWVARIARRRLCDLVKAQRRLKRGVRVDTAQNPHGPDDVPDPDRTPARDGCPGHGACANEDVQSLRRALAGLPPTYRRAIELRYLDGLTASEAASRLGRSPAATTMLCNRGLKLLREALGGGAAPIRSCETDAPLSIHPASGPRGAAGNATGNTTIRRRTTPLGASNMKSRKNQPQSQPMPFEELEGRKLFSASLSAGVLTVNGSAGNDQIQVSMSYGPLFNIINVAENGVTTGSFIASSVSTINVFGNAGNDTIAVGSGIGNTRLDGGAGDDALYGGNGNDYLFCGDGNDYANGGFGNDTIDGWNGNDYLVGGEGADSLLGWYGSDTLCGMGGNDSLSGEYDNDNLYGGDGADNLSGGTGDDGLFGDAGADSIYGGDGSDSLTGGAGQDYLSGGNGNDFFTAHDDEVDTIDGGAGWDTASIDKKEWWEFWGTQDNTSNVENAFEP
jgi:RNA polymerase sigma factor (sigma-70 family)